MSCSLSRNAARVLALKGGRGGGNVKGDNALWVKRSDLKILIGVSRGVIYALPAK